MMKKKRNKIKTAAAAIKAVGIILEAEPKYFKVCEISDFYIDPRGWLNIYFLYLLIFIAGHICL